jgi:hypothetical protein
MPGNPRSWNPKEWEKHVQLLLKRRYAYLPGSYQHVPDTVGGDWGVEGFAIDGSAYQCYAAQEWVTADELLTKQKNKMTSDIAKFIANETELATLFGTVRVSVWNLVVPYWNNKELIQHASKKAGEVEKLKLKHAADTFHISILTEDDFVVEVQLLANLNLHKFNLPAPSIAPEKLAQWMERKRNLHLVSNLRRKVELLGQGKSQESKEKFQARIVANYIGGNIVLGRLERELPDTFGKVVEYKATREANLETESFVTSKVPSEFFATTLQEYREEISKVPGIGPSAADTIAHEAVSDWLLRCPMDFELDA